MSDTVTAKLRDRIDAIEGGYEFFLSYAAKGFKGDPGTGGELRDCLQRMATAMDGLGEFLSALVRGRGLEPLPPYEAFFEVIGRDARRAQLAVQLVMAQPGISSQVIDNLNASVHLRALLTDLFLIDEILRPRASDAIPAAALAGEKPPPAGTSSTP
ncbi:MAG: hypothetical protein E2P06_15405 [Acidobacteria bacterium]|nr:hypothetical protein [Acidobacteriota bacterium]TDI20378.1 MAG: hypothetical protein E2P06_15405 [Acidobacteriota bacterium]